MLRKSKIILKQVLKNINEFIKNKKFVNEVKNVCTKSLNFDRNITFDKIEYIEIENLKKFKYVGAINYKNYVYFIPNSVNKFLKLNIDDYKYEFIDFNVKEEEFLWTGGGVYNNKLYCFPRKSNKILILNLENDNVELYDLNIDYQEEHHYGGVLTEDGIVYMPPRNNDNILKINLNDLSCSKIKISPKFLKYRYISGKINSNGLIYFLPEENEKVMVFNPINEKVKFIGCRLDAMVYDVALYNNNLYGFSGYKDGLLKIDTNLEKTSMIFQDIKNPGSYGTKVALNGLFYNIPGYGDKIYEFNPENEEINELYEFSNNLELKCAGGCLAQDGNIYCAPANGSKIIVIKFRNIKNINNEIIKFVNFFDNY